MPDQTAAEARIPAAPRIGDGALSIIAGLVLGAFAIFASLAAAGGERGAGVAMAICAALAAFLIWLGFFKRMFHMIERRLIDLESRR